MIGHLQCTYSMYEYSVLWGIQELRGLTYWKIPPFDYTLFPSTEGIITSLQCCACVLYCYSNLRSTNSTVLGRDFCGVLMGLTNSTTTTRVVQQSLMLVTSELKNKAWRLHHFPFVPHRWNGFWTLSWAASEANARWVGRPTSQRKPFASLIRRDREPNGRSRRTACQTTIISWDDNLFWRMSYQSTFFTLLVDA